MSEAGNPQSEQTLVTTAFGTVTSKRVIYNRAKGWFSGGAREDIPLKHVTAVRLESSRTLLGAAGGFLFVVTGLAVAVAAPIGPPTVWAALLFIWGVLLLWGRPVVVVNTAGNDLRPARGAPWQKAEARSFVEALRAQLFKE